MLLASLLLISCLHSFEVLLRGREKAETMVWALRAWGVSSALIMVTIFLPSMHSWAPAEAIRSSHLDFNRAASSSLVTTMGATGDHQSRSGMMRRGIPEYVREQQQLKLEFPRFHEAPAFRNGIECPFSLLSSKAQIDATCDPSAVHVAMTLDMAYLRGSMAAVLSIVQHAVCPENIIFHFLVSEADLQLQSLMRQTFPYLRFKVYPFDETLVKHRISSSVRSDLEQPLNYARNYLADILEPCIGRVIYLDSDLVLVDDIAKLWGTSLGEHTVGAPEYCHANFTKYFTSAFWSNSSLAAATFRGRNPCYFNTGVMVMDLARWRQRNYTKLLEAWMDIQKEKKIYELGSLPPFLLVFAGWVEPIEHRWNQHGLGGDYVVGSCRPLHPGPVSLLHWSGKGKPWARLDSGRPCPLDSLWAPYDLFVQQQQQFRGMN